MDGSYCDASNQRDTRGRFVLEISQLVTPQLVLVFRSLLLEYVDLLVKKNSSAAEKLLSNVEEDGRAQLDAFRKAFQQISLL